MARSTVQYDGANFDYVGGAVSTFPGAVSSVFGRTGAVVAASNDYTEAQISFSDITTNDSSTSKHGYLKKLDNSAAHFMDGQGNWSTPSGAVTSVFGRTGAVVSANNDYSDAQVQNSPTNILTTTGDVLYASAANTLARLGVGTAAQVLVGGTIPAWGAGPLGGVGWTVVTKAMDESVTSSSALQADDELFFTPVSGGIYEIELFIVYASPVGGTTPDMKFAFYEDSTVRGSSVALSLNAADSIQNQTLPLVSSSSLGAGTATTNRGLLIRGHYWGNGVQAGYFWCQNTSGSNATTVRAGSVLRYRRIV